jgi:hypothetical protein
MAHFGGLEHFRANADKAAVGNCENPRICAFYPAFAQNVDWHAQIGVIS